jgi:ADP-glucose pyrophosphorylase
MVAAIPFVEGIAKALAHWRDMGTIDASWEAHIDPVGPRACFELSPTHWPLRATPTSGPSSMGLLAISAPARGEG